MFWQRIAKGPMTRDEAIRMLRDAYRFILHMRADELPATIWAQTLGTLHHAREQVLAQRLCEACEHPVSLHEAQYGCDYECDVPDADIGQVAWRCGCKAVAQ